MTISDMLKSGCIEQDYTLNGYFVRVYPIFRIDKVKFSFVKKNTSGKDAFDIYVDTWIFQNLCDDIESGAFMRKLINDTGDYPTAFQYTTGENASRHLSIGAGKSGIVISGRVTGENPQNAMIKVVATAIPAGTRSDSAQDAYAKNLANGYAKLRCMARLYNLVSGNLPLVGYNRKLYATFWKNDEQRNKHFHVPQEEIEEPSAMPEAESTPPKKAEPAQTAEAKQPKAAPSGKEQNVPASAADSSQPSPQIQRGRFRLTRGLAPYGDMYVTKVGINGTEEFLFISKKDVSHMEPVRQDALLNLKPGTVLSICYESGFTYRKGTGILFKGFAA